MSAARLARNVVAPAVRRRVASAAPRVARRNNSSSHGHGQTKSDVPWIVGSALVFGPALLYLLSPSSKKNVHGVHDDKHDYPGLKTHHDEPKEVALKDDEGAEANVASSIKLAEADDVPNASPSSEEKQEIIKDAESEGAEEPKAPAADPSKEKSDAPEKSDPSEGKADASEKSDSREKAEVKSHDGPADEGEAKVDAQKGTTPKEQAESKK